MPGWHVQIMLKNWPGCLEHRRSETFWLREITRSRPQCSAWPATLYACQFRKELFYITAYHGASSNSSQNQRSQVQVRFGARTGAAPVFLGCLKIAMGLLFGSSLYPLLQEFPRPLLGSLLLFAGMQEVVMSCCICILLSWSAAVCPFPCPIWLLSKHWTSTFNLYLGKSFEVV